MASKPDHRPRRPPTRPLPAVLEQHAFTAEIPGASADRPAWRLRIEMVTEAQGEGERVRIRAHLHSRLGEILASLPTAGTGRAALGHETPPAGEAPASTALAPAYRLAARGLRLALAVPALRRLAEPVLRHEVDSWIELRATTADLAGGAAALLPEVEQLKALGIEPPPGDGALAQSWAGPAGAGTGFAQVSLLRFDRRHLPAALKALLGDRPFSLAAAVVNVVDRVAPPRR